MAGEQQLMGKKHVHVKAESVDFKWHLCSHEKLFPKGMSERKMCEKKIF